MHDPVGLLVMRYAFPCAEISVTLGHLTREEYEALEAAVTVGESFPRPRLEAFFPALVRRLKEVAKKEKIPDYWSEDAVHAYFLRHHDAYIDVGDGMLGRMSPTEKELCRCKVGEVIEIKNSTNSNSKTPNATILTLKTTRNGKDSEELVLGTYLGEVEKGDIVVSHRKFATEQLSPETAARHGYPSR